MRSGTMTKMRRKSKCNTRYYVHGGRYSTTVRPTYLGRSPPHAVAYTCSAAVVLHLCRIQCSWWYAPKNAAGGMWGYPQRAGRSNTIAYVLVRSLLQDIPASLLENCSSGSTGSIRVRNSIRLSLTKLIQGLKFELTISNRGFFN